MDDYSRRSFSRIGSVKFVANKPGITSIDVDLLFFVRVILVPGSTAIDRRESGT